VAKGRYFKLVVSKYAVGENVVFILSDFGTTKTVQQRDGWCSYKLPTFIPKILV
jgi:hypothetical protein